MHEGKLFHKLPGIPQLSLLSTTAHAAGAVIAVTTGGAAHRGMSCQLIVRHPSGIAGRLLKGGCRCWAGLARSCIHSSQILGCFGSDASDGEGCAYRDRYRPRSPSPRGYRGRDSGRDSYRDSGRDSYRDSGRDSYRDSGRDSYRRRSPVAPYYNRPRRTPPRSGTTLFVAGLNFVTTERVRLWEHADAHELTI